MRINVFCLFGAIVALICLALPWAGQDWHPRDDIEEYYLSDEIEMRSGHEQYERMTLALVVFIIGAGISLFTPLGGLLLLVAVADYFVEVGGQVGTYQTTGYGHIHFFLDIGFFVAVWATALVCLSAVLPFGVGYSGVYSPFSRRKLTYRERLLVWTPTAKALTARDDEVANSTVKEEGLTDKHVLITNRKALIALISASLLLLLAMSTRARRFGTDYDIAGIVWALSGLTIVVITLYSIRDDDYNVIDSGWTMFVMVWSGMIAIGTTMLFVSWQNLEYHFSAALFFTMFTSALWVLGFVFMLWGRLKGNLGALAKWLSFSVGIPFLVFAVYYFINLLFFGGFAS